MSYLNKLQEIANHDVEELRHKEEEYGASWKKRGGVGAFMMLARKWDRIEQAVGLAPQWDIFEHILQDRRPEGLLDDIGDLRRYLLLVEAEIRAQGWQPVYATGRVTVDVENIPTIVELSTQLRRLPPPPDEVGDGPQERVSYVLRQLANGYCNCGATHQPDPMTHRPRGRCSPACAYRDLMNGSSELQEGENAQEDKARRGNTAPLSTEERVDRTEPGGSTELGGGEEGSR